jgi:hypothetical protein
MRDLEYNWNISMIKNRWDKPNDREELTEEDKLRVFYNTKKYLENRYGHSESRVLHIEEPTPKGDQND